MLRLTLLAALLAVDRLDTVLLTAPACAWALWESRSLAALRSVLLGALPLLAWLAFAWFYYGFPLPNTAYAKAFGLGIPRETVLSQGLAYFGDSLRRDPVTLPAILAGVVAALGARKPRAAVVAGGVLVHLAYVLWIGGDFMSGRFFAAPLFVSVFALLEVERPRSRPLRAAGAVAAVALGLAGPHPPLLSGPDYEDEHIPERFITDERALYFQKTGLLSRRRHAWRPLGHVPPGPWKHELYLVVAAGRPGFEGGPGRHVVDDLGLCDPLVARLPARNADAFRPGHVPRFLPDGYLAFLWTGEDRIADADLARYCDELRLVTRGPLWSRERWAAIWRFATGRNHALLAAYQRRTEPPPLHRVVPIADLRERVPDGTPWHSPDVLLFHSGRVVVQLDGASHAATLELGLDGNDVYYFVVGNGERVLGDPVQVPRVSPDQAEGLRTRTFAVPPHAVEVGYTWVAIGALGGDGLFTVGHFGFGDER